MKSSNPYLFFNNGKCKAAMEYYKKIFGGELNLMTVADAGPNMPPGMDPKSVMHSLLKSPAITLMASDNGKNDTAVEVTEQNATSIKFKIPAKAPSGGRLALMILTGGKDAKYIEQPVKVMIEP